MGFGSKDHSISDSPVAEFTLLGFRWPRSVLAPKLFPRHFERESNRGRDSADRRPVIPIPEALTP